MEKQRILNKQDGSELQLQLQLQRLQPQHDRGGASGDKLHLCTVSPTTLLIYNTGGGGPGSGRQEEADEHQGHPHLHQEELGVQVRN